MKAPYHTEEDSPPALLESLDRLERMRSNVRERETSPERRTKTKKRTEGEASSPPPFPHPPFVGARRNTMSFCLLRTCDSTHAYRVDPHTLSWRRYVRCCLSMGQEVGDTKIRCRRRPSVAHTPSSGQDAFHRTRPRTATKSRALIRCFHAEYRTASPQGGEDGRKERKAWEKGRRNRHRASLEEGKCFHPSR